MFKISKFVKEIIKIAQYDDIDPEILPTLKKLWSLFKTGGYVTSGSCIGHNEPGTFAYFYIQLNENAINDEPLLEEFIQFVRNKAQHVKIKEKDNKTTFTTRFFNENNNNIHNQQIKQENVIVHNEFDNLLDKFIKIKKN